MIRVRLNLPDLKRRQAGHSEVHTRRRASGTTTHEPRTADAHGCRTTRMRDHTSPSHVDILCYTIHPSVKKLDAAVPAPRHQPRVCGPPDAPESMLAGQGWSPLCSAWVPAGTSDQSTLKVGETGLHHLGLALVLARLRGCLCVSRGRQVVFQEGGRLLRVLRVGCAGRGRTTGGRGSRAHAVRLASRVCPCVACVCVSVCAICFS